MPKTSGIRLLILMGRPDPFSGFRMKFIRVFFYRSAASFRTDCSAADQSSV